MTSEHMSILCEIVSFFFVTPEFLGPETLDRVEKGLARTLSRMRELIPGVEKNLRVDAPRSSSRRATGCLFGLIVWLVFVAITRAVIHDDALPGTFGEKIGVLLSYFLGPLLLLAISIALLAIIVGAQEYLSFLIRALAERHRLRAFIFALGVAIFLISKILLWRVRA